MSGPAGIDRDPAARERTVSIALVSHTNAGKTTLARTLLGRDIGEVRDAPHVTEFSDVHVLIETAAGERLTLWDTPGFGDSLRLAKRLRLHANPIGRFLAEIWDRWRDRPLWSSQQALRTMRDDADVLLYLVNASESVEAAGYVKPELEILAWVGKPVLVLLNQLGAPREGGVEAAEVERWRQALGASAVVGAAPAADAGGVIRAVLPLDAWARCWVQELALLHALEAALAAPRRPLMTRLSATWRAARLATFDRSMAALAASLARIAVQTEALPPAEALGERLRQAGTLLGRSLTAAVGRAAPAADAVDDDGPPAQARRALVARHDAEVRAGLHELIGLHGLGGSAEGEILERLSAGIDLRAKVDEKQAAAWGGAVTGAIAGLKADLLSGGLTLGGGLLAGGLIGALGGAGLARAVNRVRGTDRSTVAWNAAALDAMVEAAILRYLAVAHFGRGRGDWQQGALAPHWAPVVAAAVAAERDRLAAIWAERDPKAGADPAAAGSIVESIAIGLEPVLHSATAQVLAELYPAQAPAAFAGLATAGAGR